MSSPNSTVASKGIKYAIKTLKGGKLSKDVKFVVPPAPNEKGQKDINKAFALTINIRTLEKHSDSFDLDTLVGGVADLYDNTAVLSHANQAST
jgi:preprotein translocase subunit SecB